jgi:hypothetical protein
LRVRAAFLGARQRQRDASNVSLRGHYRASDFRLAPRDATRSRQSRG